MKTIKNKYILGIFLISIIGIVSFNIYTSKCHGSECNVASAPKQNEYQVHKEMVPDKIKEQVKNGDIFLLDVREESEWDEGHIEGSHHISLINLNSKTTIELPKNIPIYIYCRSGRRAEEAENILLGLKFDKALAIGGIIEWQERGGILIK